MRRTLLILLGLGAALSTTVSVGQSRLEKVLGDRDRVTREGFWIYNDWPAALKEAKESKKPLLVVLRCIPCEGCVKLDDDLIEQNAEVKPLLERFVCARIVSTNGLDLATFQFNTDQSFAVFFLNADGAIYGRFGTRSHRTDWQDDVSVAGLAKAMQGALALHADYPANKTALAAKRAAKVPYASPERFPGLKAKYEAKLEFGSLVVQNCIHCHQIGDAQRQEYREARKPLPTEVLFQFPHPKSIGLIFDPREMATVLRVIEGSPAAQAGCQAGDRIETLAGQPLLSMADVQWVLHQSPPAGAALVAEVNRDGKRQELTLTLPAGWRTRDDISWRASTWNLRRMATGGLLVERLPDEEREPLKLSPVAMALRVKHVGQYGPHAAAKNAGFQQGDIIVAFDGRDDLPRETDLIAYAMQNHQPGERVKVALLRGGKQLELELPMQP